MFRAWGRVAARAIERPPAGKAVTGSPAAIGVARRSFSAELLRNQSEYPPQRNARAQRQQRNHAVGDGHRSGLLVGEESTVGAVIERQVGRALVWQEEAIAGHERDQADHPRVDARREADRSK